MEHDFPFLAAVCPGFLAIYHYKPVLFTECNVVKLILLDLALTLPILVTNLLAFAGLASGLNKVFAKEEDSNLEEFSFGAFVMTSVILNLSLYRAYRDNLPFAVWLKHLKVQEEGLIIVCAVTLLIGGYVSERRKRLAKQVSAAPTESKAELPK